MATSYTSILMIIAGLSSACVVAAASSNRGGSGPVETATASAESPDLAELIAWHSGFLSVGPHASTATRWKSSLKPRDADESAPLLRMHGAPGFQDLAQENAGRASGYVTIPIDYRDFAQRQIRHDH